MASVQDIMSVSEKQGEIVSLLQTLVSSTKSWLHDGVGNPISSEASGTNRLIHSNTPDLASSSTALGALNAFVSLAVSGRQSIGFQLAPGTLIGTIQAQASVDGGTSWTNVPFFDPANSALLQNIIFTSANTLKILSVIPMGGASHIRVICTAYTSGTANGLLRASRVTGVSGSVTAQAFGTVVNTYPTLTSNTAALILAANPNRKYAYVSNNSGYTVNLQNGSLTGLSATTGLTIPTSKFHEIQGGNLFTGNIYGICSNDITLSVSEGTP